MLRLINYVEQQFEPALQARVRALMPPACGSVAEVCELHMLLGAAFAGAASACVAAAGLSFEQVDLIASHGQTVYHQVKAGHTPSTLQLGAAAPIAELTGCTIVHDFRPHDMAAGGQGAPLAPYLDLLLWQHPSYTRALQNIGGIANVTFLPAGSSQAVSSNPVRAFDTGPGNILIDETTRLLSSGQRTFDQDGAWAAQGTIDQALIANWLNEPFFRQQPPKSTGREHFNRAYAEHLIAGARRQGLDDAGILATITALTAYSIADAYRRFLPALPDELIVSGGGARNQTLLRLLGQALPGVTVWRSDELGLPADAKEAVLFALLGYATLHGWPANLPSCTGAQHPVVLGSITPGANYLKLLRQIAASDLPPPSHASL